MLCCVSTPTPQPIGPSGTFEPTGPDLLFGTLTRRPEDGILVQIDRRKGGKTNPTTAAPSAHPLSTASIPNNSAPSRTGQSRKRKSDLCTAAICRQGLRGSRPRASRYATVTQPAQTLATGDRFACPQEYN
ncbi:unnamed protein product [Protopolystoma xenopodis]|uniref:Uncharacterized protein n=1 Tax=Protopolystoma xenopodis TaxID=117903 RepID=A0A448WYB8_9PLAT|nr:unnamed protein product [Protopolystoma xenopodis]